MQSSKIDRIKYLVEQLNAASESYYAKDREIMSNYEYDKLYDELVELEKETGVTLANSPTVNVGYEAVDELPKERHESPMLSLGKTKSREELREWLQGNPAILSWKLDGLTIVLTYREGKLAKAVTRGNGEIGEVITNNARTFKNLPLNISYTGELILRGEAVITYSDFEKINGEIADAEAKYKNPRNLCSGSVRQLNNEITAKRNVRFYAFTLVKADDVDFHDSKEAQFAFLQEQGFLSSLPLANLDKKLFKLSKRNVLTSGAASCYPFVSYSICDDNGILFGVNKHNNSLVIADIFDSRQYKNSNICILGCSGAGKTFTMQTMALRMRRKGIQVFIIAPLKGHEFYRAARNVGGEFIQISPASKNCINIMEIRKVDNSVNELLDGPTLDASALAGKIQRLHIFFSLLIPDMSHEEKQLLDEALIKTYARKGITHKNESLTDPQHPEQYKKMPILEDVYNVLLESEDTKRLAHILNRLVHGSASSFNQQTNVDLTNKYTVLDISELTGSSDLLTVGMFVALDYVWDKAKENRTEEKAIFVDEVWQLIGASSNRLAAEFVLEIAKIIRAYSGAGIFATQDLNDFFALDDGKYGKGIINNCKTKIILNMEDEEAQRVKTILHLSETEVMNITHFQRGNGLISTNNNNITVEFKASNLEKELITTDRQELLEILAKQKKQAV